MATGPVMDGTRVPKSEHGFEWTFALGFVVIVVTKLVAREQPIYGGIAASVIGIAIMAIYMARQKRERPEGEHSRLGDEVYYLGLLYTLTSLCAALVSLFLLDELYPRDGGARSLVERTDEMVGSFGIALLTTMAGIVMRMPLQRRGAEGQATVIRIPHSLASGSGGRSVEIEGTTIDLERYAFELRRQLQTSINAFASYSNQTILQARTTHAHMDEMMKAFHDGLEEKAKIELERLEAIYKAIASNAEEVMKRTETQQASVRSTLEQLESHLKSMDESIDRIRAGSGETAENLGAIGAQAKASTRALVESGQVVTEGLSALAKATDAEKTYQETRAQFTREMGETLKRQEEALDATVKKLQALAETAGRELEGQGKLKGAIAEIADVAATAGRYGERLKDTEREIQRINAGLKDVQSAMQDEGFKLAAVLKQAIIAFDEARQGGESTRSWIGRVFRR